jgi:acyl-CoA synthetase (AMP-forming)/AMP-acid ligase II
MLTHANLLANIRAVGKTMGLNPKDTIVSWLPLYHDMGLIGLMLGSFYWGIEHVALSPLEFLRRPFRWISALSQHHATITAAPNFAYNLVTRKVKARELENVKLTSLRIALCGAEPIQPATITNFVNKFLPYGFKHEAFFPAYGLAENTLAVTFSKPGEPPYQECIDMRLLDEEGKAVIKEQGEGTRYVVSVGTPIDTVEIKIVDINGNPVNDGILGEVIISGPSVMAGYYNNYTATAKTIKNGWLYTGDIGFLLNGKLFISGRNKDIIIRAGRNYFAEDVEAAISDLQGIRPGGLSAFSVENIAKGTEDLVIIAEVRHESYKKDLPDLIKRRVMNTCCLRVDKTVLVGPRTLPKTSSGKIQRFKARQLYLNGRFEKQAVKNDEIVVFTYVKSWLRDKITPA